MKKSLLAIAAAGAFAGVAQAQSSVTVYGIVDAGVGQGATTYAAGGASKANQNWIGGLSSSNGTGQLAGSRVGFRGLEDLGGGNRVGFVYEIGVNLNNAQSSTVAPNTADTTTQAGNAAFFGNARQAYASIANNSFGELRIGTQDSLAKNLLGGFDPGAEALITGATSLYQQGVQARYPQAITYQAPTVAGVVLRVQYAGDGTTYGTQGTTNTATTNNASSISARWAQGPAAIGVVYEARNQYTVPSVPTANTQVAMLPSLLATSVPGITQFGAGASYNFGVVEPSLMYYNQKWINNGTPANGGSIAGTQLGVKAPISSTVNLTAAYITGNVQNNGSSLYTTSGFQAIANYNLSKRSRLYGIYGLTTWNSERTSVTSSVKTTQYGVGLLHTF